ncbi:MAG TPA: translation initiation factor IF-2 [Micropepsaceae bacterium]|jgi:translation initiation factor IF-2|nr:translation initiation factor IF-2 [Micropepsaceae bacterium]
MSETDDSGARTRGATGGGGKTLSLKRTETSTVRQSFSHGRSKAVVVEKKRARVMPGAGPTKVAAEAERPSAKHAAAEEALHPTVDAREEARRQAANRGGVVLRELTEDEKEARLRALTDAKYAEEELRKRAEEDAARRSVEEERMRRERDAAEKRKAEEETRKAVEEDARRRAEQEAARRLKEKEAETTTPAPAVVAPVTPLAKRARELTEEEEESSAKKGKTPAKVPAARKAVPGGRRAGKLTITRALSEDDDRMRSLASFRRQQARAHRQQQAPAQAGPREVIIPETITVAELANRMARRGVDIIKVLMKSGMMVTTNDTIDADTAELVATELGHSVKRVAESDVLEGLRGLVDDDADLTPRPPIVTVMGHVDHGKTSLLDALRKTDVVAGEAGGITQHIGAYQVQLPSGAKITFLDTPGHAAFTAMRARGAKVTDLVILVVAADDGVMPQTVEAIAHAKAAGVPIIVAINKVDKADSNPMRVKNELLQHEIQVEELGGDVLAVEVSATKGIGLEKLEEAIILQSEVLDLKANPRRPADGAVIEAKLDKGRGPVATVLVQRGTLHQGDIIVAGAEWGRVRALVNDRGETVNEAGPSQPVEVLGLSAAPEAGDEFVVVESEGRAREVSEYRGRKRRETRQATISRQSLDQLLKSRKEGEKRLLPLVIKTDVQGSLEAVEGSLARLGTEEVGAQILHGGVGGITESDVILAQASGAAIIGFNVRANAQARDRARRDGVEIRYYNIIYNVIDDVKAVLSGMLAPETRERFLGNAQILEVFNISKVGKVAGCRVTEGLVRRGAKVRLIRQDVVIHEGDLSTLKRFKDEVREVQSGQECGMAFTNYQDMQKGDIIECYEVETIKRTL